MIKDGGMEEYHGYNLSSTSGAEICGETWMPTFLGRAPDDDDGSVNMFSSLTRK